MIMQSDLRDVYHGVHITGFHPVEIKDDSGKSFQGVMNDFYVQVRIILIKKHMVSSIKLCVIINYRKRNPKMKIIFI